MSWDRNIEWRQGMLFETAFFEPIISGLPNCYIIVISHDCDIANDQLDSEPNLEFILARIIDKPDGSMTNAKNVRKLHIPIILSGTERHIELLAKDKIIAPKESLCLLELPADTPIIELPVRHILQDWLACRYRRQAFTESLGYKIRPLETFLQKKSKGHANQIIGYWLSIEPLDIELSDEPYEISFFVIYNPEIEGAEAIAMEIAEGVTKLASDGVLDPNSIDLLESSAYSDTEFTLADLRRNVCYRLDHISNKEDPELFKA